VPSAYATKYEVGEEVATRFGAYPDALLPHPHGDRKRYLDVPAVLHRQLTEAGIPAARIERSAGGTLLDHRYHSHRRSGFAAGRMAAFLAL
jgi:copper oxidase (laccase) domain-containing protein